MVFLTVPYARIAILMIFVFSHNDSFAQTENVDSLYQLVESAKNEEDKIKNYRSLLWELHYQAHPQLGFYAEELLNYAQSINTKEGIAEAHRYKGMAESFENKYEEAIKFYAKARELYVELENYEMATIMQVNIYVALNTAGRIKESETAFKEYEELVQCTDTAPVWAQYYEKQAIRMSDKENMEEMVRYSKKAIELYESLGERYLEDKAIVLANMANSSGANNLEESVIYLKEALEIAKKIESYPFMGYVSLVLSSKYRLLGNYEDAILLLHQGVATSDSLVLTNLLVQSKVALGSLYEELQDEENTLKEYEEALALAEKANYYYGILDCFTGLASYYGTKENYEKAIYFGESGIAIADSINRVFLRLEAQQKVSIYYIKSGQADKGYKLLQKTLEENKGANPYVKAICYSGLAHYFSEKGNWLKVKEFSQKAYDIFDKEANLTGRENTANFLYEANKHQKNYIEALKWLEISKELDEKVLNEENIRKLTSANLNAGFNEEKKIIAIEQEKQEVLLEAKAERNLLAAGGIGALALLAFGFFYNARRNNQKIAAQNTIISEKNTQLEQVNQTKDRIFAIIGHDLRKPVVAFSGISETINYLIKKEDYATLQQLGGEIEKDGFALQKLTDNLLNWALTQRDVMPYNPQEVKLADKAEEILLIFEKVARDKNIELINKVPLDLNIFADPNSLLTIIINLVDNALKYTNGGRVEINAVTDIKGTRLEVTDTGVGIPKEQLKDIFLLQKDKSKKGTGGEKGTGLGLHLVNELVKLNHGEIAAESREGKGTIFRVLLPAEKLKTA